MQPLRPRILRRRKLAPEPCSPTWKNRNSGGGRLIATFLQNLFSFRSSPAGTHPSSQPDLFGRPSNPPLQLRSIGLSRRPVKEEPLIRRS
jgi:hypothetical protein